MDNSELLSLKKKLEKTSFVRDLYVEQSFIQNDERFGDISLWTKKEGEDLIFSKKVSLDDEAQCNEALECNRGRKELNYDYLLKLVDYDLEIRNLNEFEVTAFYEAPFQDLKKEIETRKTSNR
jgi:hypothetical protein